jgi:hypothetical protein
MNEDRDMHDDRTMDDEIEARLQAYADARLSPSPEVASRMRTAIVARAAGAQALREIGRGPIMLAGTSHPGSQRRGSPISWLLRPRRVAALVLAATVAVGSTAAVVGATPGNALYGARLWLEGLTLPASSDARAAAQVGQLAQRVQEAENAAKGGDPNAVAAALGAYQDEIGAALRDAGEDSDRLARLHAALGVHVVALQTLESAAPAGAAPAINAAIDASHQAVKQIEAKTQTPPPAPTPPPPPTPRPSR